MRFKRLFLEKGIIIPLIFSTLQAFSKMIELSKPLNVIRRENEAVIVIFYGKRWEN
nr:MAG TPA: hypothetical protein [Caudoviricetes sp.]